jgi:hypothetical protein
MEQAEILQDFDLEEKPMTVEERDLINFQITDDGQAAWAMRKLLSLKNKMLENEEIAKAEQDRINSWLIRVNGRFDADVSYFEAILTQYARNQRNNEGRKTIDTPYGVVKSRATQSKFKVENVDEFLQWASINAPQLVNIKASPNLTALKDYASAEETQTLGAVAMTSDGEIIPGVTVDPANINFTVEVAR